MRTVRILLPVVLAVTLLGACGGGARDEAAASTTVPPSSSSTGSTTTVGSVPTSELADSGTVEIPDDAVDMTGRELVTVVIEDNVFIERSIVVSAGTEVMWVNKGRNPHNVTPSEEGSFEPRHLRLLLQHPRFAEPGSAGNGLRRALTGFRPGGSPTSLAMDGSRP